MRVLDHRNFPYPSYHRRENDTYCDLTIWLDNLSNPTKAVILVTEIPENKGTSVTNRIRKIQELVMAKYQAVFTELAQIMLPGLNIILAIKVCLPHLTRIVIL